MRNAFISSSVEWYWLIIYWAAHTRVSVKLYMKKEERKNKLECDWRDLCHTIWHEVSCSMVDTQVWLRVSFSLWYCNGGGIGDFHNHKKIYEFLDMLLPWKYECGMLSTVQTNSGDWSWKNMYSIMLGGGMRSTCKILVRKACM